jgi:high-affinity iron transporter
VAAAFFLMLREGLEAALIVGIIAAYLVKTDRRDALRDMWLGVALAVALSVVAGAVVVATVGRLPSTVQETFEAIAALVAVAVLTWTLFWMRRQGRAMKGDLERGIETALSQGSTLALVGLAFVAVAREGFETMLFFLALLSSTGGAESTLLGATAGLVVAIAIGWAIFAVGIRVDLRAFFTATGAVLIFVAAGLCAFAVGALGEAGLIANTGSVYDLGSVLPVTSPLGSVLAGLFGYRSAPTPLEALAYLAYLIPVLTLFLFQDRIVPRRHGVAPA